MDSSITLDDTRILAHTGDKPLPAAVSLSEQRRDVVKAHQALSALRESGLGDSTLNSMVKLIRRVLYICSLRSGNRVQGHYSK